jgi:hypothetical protein
MDYMVILFLAFKGNFTLLSLMVVVIYIQISGTMKKKRE